MLGFHIEGSLYVGGPVLCGGPNYEWVPIMWEPLLCKAPIMWGTLLCGGPYYVGVLIMWWPNYVWAPIMWRAHIMWEPILCGGPYYVRALLCGGPKCEGPWGHVRQVPLGSIRSCLT